MGRSKIEGTKNIIHILHQSRFQEFYFTDGKKKMKLIIATNNYDRLAAGLEKRGYRAIHE